MALTSSTTFDVANLEQSCLFLDPGAIDGISFASNVITFNSTAGFNLSKADFLLYFKYMDAFNILLNVNFPQIATSSGIAWPLSSFYINEYSEGVTHLVYTQTSGSNTVMNINYVSTAQACSFASRSSTTISLQEFAMLVYMMRQYANQVFLN